MAGLDNNNEDNNDEGEDKEEVDEHQRRQQQQQQQRQGRQSFKRDPCWATIRPGILGRDQVLYMLRLPLGFAQPFDCGQ
jgi:hypothetical protein